MDPVFKRNYQNKVDLLTRQITGIVNLAREGDSFREKLTHLPPDMQGTVLSLLKLRQQLKLQLKRGPSFEIRTSFYRESHFTLFRTTNPMKAAQQVLIERIKHDQHKVKRKAPPIFTTKKRSKPKPR